MKGDFSRFPLQRQTRYRGVLPQQGRLQLDSDWTAQFAIRDALERAVIVDTLGRVAVPSAAPGFGLELSGGELMLTAGRCYVEGVLCETGRIAVREQPFLTGELPGRGNWLAYLDVWTRTVSPAVEPSLAETALGGSEGALRVEAVWQVRFAPQDARDTGDPGPNWKPPDRAGTTARLEVRAANPALLGNHLYRVEIHAAAGQSEGSRATWKWSRNNASVVLPIARRVPSERNVVVELAAPASHAALLLEPGQWVEVLDDRAELQHEPRPLWQVASTEPSRDPRMGRVMLVRSAPADFPEADPGKPLFLRRWDHQTGTRSATAGGALAVGENDWQPLESGVEVRFVRPEDGESEAGYAPGDYWLFSTRTGRGVEWSDASDPAQPQPPAGIHHLYAPLGRVLNDRTGWHLSRDLRRLFHPAVDLTTALVSQARASQAAQKKVEELTQKLAAAETRLAALENGRKAARPAPE